LKSDSRKVIGGLIIGLGIIFLIDSLFDFDFWNFIWKLWPVALIVLGVYILRNQSRFRGDFKSGDMSSDSRLFGDMDISLSGKEVVDHHYSTLIGDVKIDLTGAEFVPGEKKISISFLIGDVRIKIPENIPVKLSSQSLIGDIRFDDMKRDGFFQKLDHVDDNYESAGKKLFLSVSGVIGDLEVCKMKIDDVN
jgi:lia operon protein LiaF